MEAKVDVPLEIAKRNLFERLRNLGFTVHEINRHRTSEHDVQVVFSLTTNSQADNIEYFSLRSAEDNSAVLRKVDLTDNRWYQAILTSWLVLDSHLALVEKEMSQAA